MNKLVSSEINEYCELYSQHDSELLKQLIQETYANEDLPQMISGIQVGNILQGFIKLINAKQIIEVGMFTGYSSLKMAEALDDDGRVYTCELMEKHIRTAQTYFDRSPDGKKINILAGEATKSLEELKANSFDLAFIDADKINYRDYYLKCMALIKKGGLIILDNMLWSGAVLEPNDEDSLALNNLAQFINKDTRVMNYLLPVRDGLMVCIKH